MTSFASAAAREGPVSLWNDPRMRITIDEETRLVWMVRTAHPLPVQEQPLRDFYAQVVDAMDGVDRASHALLIDSRAAVGRNDETFERVQAEVRWVLFGGFRRVAAVVRTFAGRLQVSRYVQGTEAMELGVCGTVDEALAFLGVSR